MFAPTPHDAPSEWRAPSKDTFRPFGPPSPADGGRRITDTGSLCKADWLLGLGAIVMMLVFWVEFRCEPPWWVHAVLWLPFITVAAIWLLRLLKALLINQQYIHRSTALEE